MVTLDANGRRQVREVRATTSYQSSSDRVVHFGIGQAQKINRLTVAWPSGLTETFPVAGVDKLVDFNMADFRISYDRQIVSDSRGRAHYFNNIGVERMLDGDAPLALAYFRESIREDKTFSPAWVNLGTLYNREGYPNHAEAAYLKALDVDDSSLVALSNLASLYEREGRGELAVQYQNKIQSHRMQNPYYRYQLARLAFDKGDYATAIDHLKIAVRKNRNDDNFYFLMSLSYLNSGDRREAQHWMKKAEKVAEMDEDKKRYHNKLDLLLRNDAGS